MTDLPLVEVNNLSKHFQRHGRTVAAVNGLDFVIHRGETLGLVGESGCGKSTTGRLMTRLIDPSGGTVSFDGTDIFETRGADLRAMRQRFQVIFQDPASAFNPRMTVAELIGEPLRIAGWQRRRREERVREILPLVGLPTEHATRYPGQFSGGQRQRIGIARALALNPEFLFCDEPVSALDVSVQAQVINLLVSLQREFKLTYLFVSHDLRVVRHIADRVAVMYLGRIVELAGKHRLFAEPRHPYTRMLLAAVPSHRPGTRGHRIAIVGEAASTAQGGCHFRDRCPLAQKICAEADPPLRDLSDGQSVACHLA